MRRLLFSLFIIFALVHFPTALGAEKLTSSLDEAALKTEKTDVAVPQENKKSAVTGSFDIIAANSAETGACKVLQTKEETKLESAYRSEGKLTLAKVWDLSKDWATEPVIYIIVDRQGQLVQSRIVHSSGNAQLDEDSLKRINAALPLGSLPTPVANKTIDFLVSPSIARILLHPVSKIQQKKEELSYNYQSRDWIKGITRHFNDKFKELKFKKVELVRVYMVIYEETGEIILKKIDQSSCDPAFDQRILDLIQPPIPKAPVISPSRVLRMYLDFKSRL